jgi:hypothetical protein
MGSCNKGMSDFEVQGTITQGDSIYDLIVSFGTNQPVAGTYKTVYNGSSSAGLTGMQCRMEMTLTRISDGFIQPLKATVNQDVIVTTTGTDKYKVSFSNVTFGIQPGGTATRVVSATSFGCE